MTEDLEIETYLSISNSIIGIYLFDIKRLKNLYKNEIKIENQSNILDTNILNSFLEENVFKIEKLLGEFINNIYLIVENNKTNNIYFGIKKKVYGNKIDKKYLENLLTDAKDLFNENYKNEKIMHMLINAYIANGKQFKSFEQITNGNDLCVELEFKSISLDFVSNLENILKKYQISILDFLDGNYVKNFFNNDKEISKMTFDILNGCNENEVMVVQKNTKKLGFFEKFFNLFD